MTRVVVPNQMKIGEYDIANIKINPRSRDDIPQILKGLQYLYITPEIKTQLFEVLTKLIPSEVNTDNGRPGMDLWKVFVMGTLRVNLNWDYDRLEEMVNSHKKIREMLGHGTFNDEYEYSLQCLKDNVHLLTPELLDEINQLIVNTAHGLVKKKDSEITLQGRCDSFVVETNVHFPTDISLLFDAMKSVIGYVSQECRRLDIEGWRQSQYNIRQIKQACRKAQQAKKGKNDSKIKEAHTAYIDISEQFLTRIQSSKTTIEEKGVKNTMVWAMIDDYINHAIRQIDQIRRRVLQEEKIPHSEKIFSIYEPHTEWVSKGKLKAPVELGLKTCIMEDQFGFILHHRVMEKEMDVNITIPMVQETKKRFKNFIGCSFDKGFYSKANKLALQEQLEEIVLPKKGRLNKQEAEEECNKDYRKRRHQHSAVESGINALEIHGLDRCLDHGIIGFKRYVALAIVGRNIQQIGSILRNKDKHKFLLKKTA
jgi:hypothetical protein